MKPRCSLPPHLLLLLFAMLVATGWQPCAGSRGTQLYSIQLEAAGDTQPLLLQPLPRIQPLRDHELSAESDEAARPSRIRTAASPIPVQFSLPDLPAPEPLRPSWRGLVSFPLPPPAPSSSPA